MPIISCPQCGARRNTPAEKLPLQPGKARCPECRTLFNFDPADYRLNEEPPSDATTQTCPHCGLPRRLPANRRHNQQATFNCRRCQRPFQLKTAAIPTSSATQLRSIGALLADSWELFCRRGWGLLAIYLLGSLLIFAPLSGAALFLPELVMGNRPLAWLSLVIAISYGLFGAAWLTASLFTHVCRPELGIVASIGQGFRTLWSFALLLVLLGVIVSGGSLLLIIPGLIFAVWFFFCQYILADQGIGGFQALEKSRQLVKGHWWAVSGRFFLLLLVAIAVTSLSARLPVIGAPINFAISLLLTPFSLIYYWLVYQDLKKGHTSPNSPNPASQWLALTLALFGWLLIPGLLLVNNQRQIFTSAELALTSQGNFSRFFYAKQNALLDDQPEPATTSYAQPEALTLADYDRLLNETELTVPEQGVKLGPATLAAEQFWADEREPHLWLKLQLADLPNLALSQQHSARIQIDTVLDSLAHDRYDREHSFEHPAFHWVNILSDHSASDSLSGIRNIYLREGTRPEQIRSISGQLEINLPLGIQSLQLKRSDIGKTLQVAGKQLTLNAFDSQGVSLNFQGERAELLSIRAINQAEEPLREAGATWQQLGESLNLRQMFSGQVDQVTLLIASDSVTRSYPFEITR